MSCLVSWGPKQYREQYRDFKIGTASFLADLSALAYRDRDESGQGLNLESMDATFFSKGGTECFLVNYYSFRVLAFRGSEAEDIVTDLKFRKRKQSKASQGNVHRGNVHRGNVHRGFAEALDLIWPELLQEIQSIRRPLFITGHSLGGALATLAAARLAFEDPEYAENCLASIYTFGSPRCGDPGFSRYLDVKAGITHHRIVNGMDIVPMLPFITMNYAHSGQMHYITGRGKLVSGISIPAQIIDLFITALRSVWAGDGFRRWLPWRALTSHSIHSYIDRLCRI